MDIACAQPALLALQIAQANPTNGLKVPTTYKHTSGSYPASVPACPSPDPPLLLVPSFSSTVLAGRLYELLMDRTGLDRDRVKLAFLRDVLAKRGRYPSIVERAFGEMFPAVLRYIRAVNHTDHGTLIRHLQRLESWLVVEQVASRLIGACHVLRCTTQSTAQLGACQRSKRRSGGRSTRSVVGWRLKREAKR